ncbi:MAG TPA: class I SAM-dependent methyltransferase [Chlamydiales bacterium]|nr:class I SAM-dependent methyltransferase [Chlamydiales bacterium]
MKTSEKEAWDRTADMLGNFKVHLGDHWSFNFFNDPKRLAFVLSRYKLAAKMACKKGRVLELGCSTGIGATILGEFTSEYVGVDLDESAIQTARSNLTEPKFRFLFDDFMGKIYGQFDAVVSLDVVEHIHLEYEDLYFKTVVDNLAPNGICVIGTPNVTSAPYAAPTSQIGHVNLYSQDRLVKVLKKYFHQVFPFGINDEIVHTGYASMAHYIVGVGFYKKAAE